MTTVDERVVALRFDNKQFLQAVQPALDALDKLNKSLKMEGAAKGFDALSAAGQNVKLGHIATAVDAISEKFRTLSIIGITALTNIVNKAVDAGMRLTKSLTLDPIIAGFREYELNLNSIQTTMANTGREGAKGLSEVTAALEELNRYSDKTIYSFAEMAKNIGTFTAAGVSLETATSAIKGIANLAAISGSNSQQAAAAMYQLSQAISAGKVSLEDWNSVVNAGMGGKVFQQALMETARIHGVAIDQMIKDEGSFRLTLQKGWLSSEILTETLSKFTGDLTEAQLKTMGYNQEQIAGILKMGQVAQDAATKVKTMSQLISTLQEAVGSGWAKTWQLIFGDFEEAKTLFTNASEVLNGFVESSANARNKILSDWKELGGRTVLIDAISNAFTALKLVLKPIGDAFREIFPPVTAQTLYNMTVALKNFTENLKIGATSSENLKRTFAGVFAILDVGLTIVKEAVKTFLGLFGIVFDGSGSFLEITAKIGDFVVELRNAIKEGNGIQRFFSTLGQILALPIRLLQNLGGILANLFGKIDTQKATKAITGVVGKLEPLGNLGNNIISIWGKVQNVIKSVWDAFSPLAERMGSFFSKLGSTISKALGGIEFGDVLGAINTGLFAGLVLLLNKLIGGGGVGGFLDNINDTLEGLTDTLGAMQNTLRAATLLEIAIAVGVLTLSVSALSKIDAGGLTRALTAITVMFTQLFASMAVFEKLADSDDIAKVGLIAAAMILLAIAVDILAVAVKKLADLSWNELARGLVGVTAILAGLIATVKLMPGEKRLIATSAALVVLSVAVKALASSVEDLSELSWEELAKGLIGVGALLGALLLFTKFSEVNKGGVLQAAGLLVMAAAIKVLASAVEDLSKLTWEEIAKGLTAMAGGLLLIGAALYLIPPTALLSAAGVFVVAASLGMIGDAMKTMGSLSWEEIAKGLVTMAIALTLIGAALWLIPPTALLSAAGVIVVAMALGMIADAMKDMAKMTWEEIAKGLVVLAGSLTIITAALMLLSGAVGGAVALVIVAGALAILAPILQMFGQMSWEEIGKGLFMLAAALTIIGVAGLLLGPVIPALIGLGVAIALIGVGMLAAGVGVLAFSAGLTALSIGGAAATAVLVNMVKSLAALIPEVMAQVGKGVATFAGAISEAAPAITMAITVVLLSIIQAIETLTPRIILVLFKLLTYMLETMVNYVPRMVDAGLRILTGFLNGVADNMNRVVTAATNVVVEFINSISRNQSRVIQAGVDLIISYVNGLAKAIRDNSARMGEAGANLASAIIEGMVRGLSAGAGRIADKARSVALSALNAAKDALGISSPSKETYLVGEQFVQGAVLGISRSTASIEQVSRRIGEDALAALSTTLSGTGAKINAEFDFTPTVKPLVDLRDVVEKAGDIDRILSGSKALSFDTTYSAAVMAEPASEVADTDDDDGRPIYTFNQYNTSPKALSSADIYRQTNNQLSMASSKGQL